MSPRLDGQLSRELNIALKEAFPSRQWLRELLRYEFDEDLESISDAPNLRAVVFDVIRWAESQGRLDELIQAARRVNPYNPDLQKFMVHYSGLLSNVPLTIVVLGNAPSAQAVQRLLEDTFHIPPHMIAISQTAPIQMKISTSLGSGEQLEIANVQSVGELPVLLGTASPIIEPLSAEPHATDKATGLQDSLAITHAELDQEWIIETFISTPWFPQVVGNPALPKPAIVFGSPGHGKTSQCLVVADKARGQRALVVILRDFESIVGALLSNKTVSEAMYIDLVRNRIVEELLKTLNANTSRRKQLAANMDLATQFWAAKTSCGQYASLPMFDDTPIAQRATALVECQRFTLVEWLAQFAAIARGAGFESIYLLIDGMSSLDLEQSARVAGMLDPLFAQADTLAENGVALKCFLPRWFELQPAIRELNTFSIEWNDQQLRRLLSRWLESYQNAGRENNNINREITFADLCEQDLPFDPDTYLIQASVDADGAYSPRVLAQLTRAIIGRHREVATEATQLISAETIRAVLGPCEA